ncbi:DnaJ subfamily C member 2 [Paragonimus westermani]|uniref:DnaJ subfamily C member 2 n=1 Tax=Paragonimus westermani TaxID=34504 RepID=A0A5J4NGW9_9TREM|nr:DnaJ subfamily C member 2 [Paragonimus westermani]
MRTKEKGQVRNTGKTEVRSCISALKRHRGADPEDLVPALSKEDGGVQSLVSGGISAENYDTTRDYSFLDEEDKEKGEDRETRRAIERQNRAERARRRADELRSVRQIVEVARENDPRLLAAIKAERDLKAAKRQARLDALREKRAAEEQQARLEAEQLSIARAASEERRRTEADRIRRERDQVRQEAKRERRRLRAVVVDRYDHFCQSEPRPADSGAERVRILAALDLLCQRLSNVQLQDLNTRLEQTTSGNEARDLFNAKFQEIQRAMQPPGLQIGTKSSQSGSSEHSTTASIKYSPEVIQALIKAVNLLPAGTPKRWEAIAAYINQHVPNASISGKEALKQAKALSHDDTHLRKEANTKAFDAFSSSMRESEATKNVTITSELEADAARPWTVTEQRALEQALRSCSGDQTSAPGEDRWQRIANIVGTRTRRECMLRCKELSDQVRAKKAAIAAATKGSTQNGLAIASAKSPEASKSKPT